MKYKKRTVILLIFIVLTIYLFQNMIEYNKEAYRLYANEGVLNLTDKSWNDYDKYLLSGEWEVYDGLLITPEEIDNKIEDRTFLTDYRKSINPDIHKRTYHLRIFTKNKEDIGLLISEIKAFKLWINNSPVLEYKFDEKNSEIRRMNTVIIDKDWYKTSIEGYELDILLQVKDRLSYRERPLKIIIGTPYALIKIENTNLVLNTLAIGFYFLVVVYSFSLFLQKRSERYLLYLGFLGINNIIANSLDSNILTVLSMFNIRAEGWERLIDLATFFIPTFIFMLCNHLFFGSISKLWQKILIIAPSIMAIVIAFLPLDLSLIKGNLSLYLVRILVPINILIIIFAFLKKKCDYLILAGGLLFGMAFIFEVAINTGFIPVGILSVYINTSQYAYLIFTVFVVLTVGNRFAKKFDEVDQLTVELEYINKNLEGIVDEKTKELQESYENIVELQEKRKNLLMNISHDLRSPLFVIKGYMEVIMGGLVKDQNAVEQYLKRMQVKIEYLSKLIEDLFLIARLEDNKIDFHMEIFDLLSLIEQVSKDLKIKAENKNIKITCNSTEEKLNVEGDRYRIQQVFENIIGNSIKYTEYNGNIIIYIWKTNYNKVIAKVQDNGVGIFEEDLPHIFERYYKGVRKHKNDESTGLGLSIAREIVEKHGGRIWAENQPEGGTSMYVELPQIIE